MTVAVKTHVRGAFRTKEEKQADCREGQKAIERRPIHGQWRDWNDSGSPRTDRT